MPPETRAITVLGRSGDTVYSGPATGLPEAGQALAAAVAADPDWSRIAGELRLFRVDMNLVPEVEWFARDTVLIPELARALREALRQLEAPSRDGTVRFLAALHRFMAGLNCCDAGAYLATVSGDRLSRIHRNLGLVLQC